MIKTVKIYYLFMWLLAAGQAHGQEVPKLRIDPSKAYGGGVSEYFDEVEYIPLETTKESLFGEAIKVIITDSSFIFFDPDTNALLFFDSNGKFLSKTTYPEREWPEITSDLFSKKIFARYRDQKGVIDQVFNLTGRLITERKIEDLTELDLSMYAIRLSDSVYIIRNSCYYPKGIKPKNKIINSIEIYNRNKLLRVFMPVNQKEQAAYCGLSPGSIINVCSPQDSKTYLTTTFTHFIYELTKDSTIGLYQLIFPSNRTAPESYLNTKNIKLIDSLRQANWTRKEELIVRVMNVSITKDFLFLKLSREITYGQKAPLRMLNTILFTILKTAIWFLLKEFRRI